MENMMVILSYLAFGLNYNYINIVIFFCFFGNEMINFPIVHEFFIWNLN